MPRLLEPHRCRSTHCTQNLERRGKTHFVLMGDTKCPLCDQKSLAPLELVHFLVEDAKGGVAGAYPGFLRQKMRIVCDKGNYYLNQREKLNRNSPLVVKAYSVVRSAVTCVECLRQMGVDVTKPLVTT